MKLSFLGLGVMGFPMAGHLARGGHEVCVYNRTAAKAAKWVETYGGTSASTPKEAAADSEIVFACVGGDDDVREIALGENGALDSMKKSAIFVDHTTASARLARELHAQAGERGLGFLDAPVSGGQAGAENGTLTIMLGGDADTFTKVEPVLQCYAQAARLMGEAGCGQLTKMVNQICIAGLVQGLAEGIHFGKHAGLDIGAVMSVIDKGAASSWQMSNRSSTMTEGKFDFGFAIDWMRKDLGFCLDEAKRNGASLPITALVDQFYAELQSMGGGRWDSSALIARLEASEKKR
ncbi:MAG: NAD(P)-dependent oxidoreductase [Hyphomicrobiales bacterium]|nr:NAD(P)-dependent oxidoreductase [Hyphomicrobiales bacterium]